MSRKTILSYAGCSTCRKALSWLDAHGVDVDVRAIVEKPPTRAELAEWVPASGLPLQKWFNTSGQSYRALDKDEVKAASDTTKLSWLSKDGKLVKRPVLVDGNTVLVGFDEAKYAAHFGKKKMKG